MTRTAGRAKAPGFALMRLDQGMADLKDRYSLTDDDLNLDLGPLGRLL